MQDRAIATRKALLEATLECLVEKGYAGTTTQEVCRRLKVSRGTLLHHFATREELVTEAVEHVLERTVEHFRETLDGTLPENPTLADLGRAMWEKHWTSGVFYAWLELVVASRTDPVLNEKVREMDLRWSPKFDAACRSVLGRGADGVIWLFFLALNALSIEKIRSGPERLNRSLSDLLALAETADRFFWRFSETALQNKGQGDKKDACDR
ncbi:MAG: TetR/AcrR family transcriptional regulator [Deltaproteobacteria bacterium]|nr:TetR/AcrR family transcriptional regulator [Deltaproteobacteria bacterium]